METKEIESLIGQKFGKLTVLKFIEFKKVNTKKSYQNIPIVECLCECGEKINKDLYKIRKGEVTKCSRSCTSQTEQTIQKTIGKKFGTLTAYKFVGFKKVNERMTPMIECNCECGDKTTLSLYDVRREKIKTCGIKHSKFKDRDIIAFNKIYSRYANGYKEFNITKDEFKILTQRNCYYCGRLPQLVKTKKELDGKYPYNGLDRIDNSKGYFLNNVVTCCCICNHAKHTMTYQSFIEWIFKIANFKRCSPKIIECCIEKQPIKILKYIKIEQFQQQIAFIEVIL